jgi:predicted nucleotidyltransferase
MSRDIREQFTAALDRLIEQVKDDRSVLAAILCGSLSHDTVWARSDIDLLLITVDDRKIDSSDLALYADGINVHANLIPRAKFRKAIEGSLRNSFIHSLIAKGRVLYSHDPTIADLASAAIELGDRDTQLQLLEAATSALPPIYKAHKWFITRGDLDYTALWILFAATPLARIEVVGRRLLADREVIPQAALLNPEFFRIIYTDLLNAKKTRRRVEAALAAIDAYIETRAPELFAPVLDYLAEVGDVRTASEIEMHFRRDHGIGGVITACEYLADRGMIGKVSAPVHLTKRSNIEVQELAFVDIGGSPIAKGAAPGRTR